MNEKINDSDQRIDDAYYRVLPDHIIDGDYRLPAGEPDDLRLEAINLARKNRGENDVDPVVSDAIYGEMARLRVGLEFLDGMKAEPVSYIVLLAYYEQQIEQIFGQHLGDRAIYPTRLQE